jgi:hypothetical protein
MGMDFGKFRLFKSIGENKMRSIMTAILFSFLSISLVFAGIFSSYPSQYSAEPIEGRVIDKDTGKPIEGVIVVAQWVLAKPPEGHEEDQWQVFEAVTDSEGRYHIPGWGPLPRPSNRWLTDYDPEIVLFMPGYWPYNFPNNKVRGGPPFNPPKAPLRKSAFNKMDLDLYPFKIGEKISPQLRNPNLNPYSNKEVLTDVEWADQISALQILVYWNLNWPTSEWKRIPGLIREIQKECLKLPKDARFKIQRLPDKIRTLIIGDLPPCAGGS